MPYVLREWSAPETLINSLADGTGIDASVAATKSSFADFLVKGGVAPAQAAEAADALVHRIIDNLAYGNDSCISDTHQAMLMFQPFSAALIVH